MNNINNDSVLNIMFNSNIFLRDHSFILNDISDNEIDFLAKYKNKFLNERHHTIHTPIYTKIGIFNCEINVFYRYKINIFNSPILKLTKKVNLKITLNNISNYAGEYYLFLDYNGKYNLKLINNITKELIIKKSSKYFENIIEPFKSLFLTNEELEIFNATNFKDLKNGWLETYHLIEY